MGCCHCYRSSAQITAEGPVFLAVDAILLMTEPVIFILGSRESRLTHTEPFG